MAFEITPNQENWVLTEVNDAVDDDDEAYEDWKAGEIEYGQWTNQFDDAEDVETNTFHESPYMSESGKWTPALH